MSNPVVVKQVPKRPFFDLFVGKGWRNWTRIHRGKTGENTVISGMKLDPDFIETAVKNHFQEKTNAVS
jgi:hypothetical protein